MDVLYLGDGPLGERIHPIFQQFEDRVIRVREPHELVESVERHGKFDWMVSAGFRHIVAPEYLASATDACNVHPSLLPWGRGAHPNAWVLAEGEPAGVSIHRMVPAVDAGPIFAQREVATTLADTAADLYDRLLDCAADLFASVWPRLRTHEVGPRPQSDGGSYHRSSELRALADINLDEVVTWRRAIDVMRALTFPPHRNLVVEGEKGRPVHIEIKLTELEAE